MTNRPTARIIGIKSYLPDRILTNFDLEKMVDTTDEWIVSRTGMRERRIAAKDECTSDLGAEAARRVLSSCELDPEQVDMILVATMSPDYICPSTACIIQAKIGATHAAAMDLGAACSGFLYGLSMAKAYIESGQYKNVLLIATEKMSAFIDYEDRSTCVLFGDGASAVIVAGEGSGLRIDTVRLGADGSLADLMSIPAGGAKHPASLETVKQKQHFFRMEGNEVFKHAVRRMTKAAKDCLEKEKVNIADVDWLIPHQANIRIIEAIAKQFEMAEEKIYKTVHKYGNTSASSIAIALNELIEEHEFKKEEKVLLLVFGVGLTWGASILTKVRK